jgi:transketolase
VDHNNLQGFGSTEEVASMSPLWNKLRGFDVDIRIVDGHEPGAIREALGCPTQRVSIVILSTVKGHGVSFMENRMEWHYLPLKVEQYQAAIEEIDNHATATL